MREVQERWPGVLISIGYDGVVHPYRGRFLKDDLPEDEASLCIARDEAMMKHWDRHGYKRMRDGDGPFAIIYRVRQNIDFQLLKVTEPREDPRGPLPPEPYAARFASPRIVEFTVVTPDAPEDDRFASWILGVVCRACRQSGE